MWVEVPNPPRQDWCWDLLLTMLLATALVLCACTQPQNTKVRIGTYDSRAIAIAWAGTKPFSDSWASLQSDYQKAKAAGDQKRVEELEAQAQARQQLQHLQAFSTASVDDILAHIEDSLPAIKQNAGVTMLASKWDEETLAKYPSAELVDVTMALVDAFHPSEVQRKTAVEIQKSEPVPPEEAEKIKDW
jgi:hypothetical protein